MRNNETSIDASKVTYHVNKLKEFLGEANIDRCLKRYKLSLEKSGPIFRDYHLQKKHPWWKTLMEINEVIDRGKVLRNNLTPEIIALVGDAKKVTTLQQFMPDSVREKYKKDLLDDENAKNYLFEIAIAWHFYLHEASIVWYDINQGKQPEYLVRTPTFEFNVECKRLNIDVARKIKRKDFYRFSDLILPEINKKQYTGKIEIVLKGRLENSDCNFNYLKTQILQVIEEAKSNRINCEYQISTGKIFLDLIKSNGEPIDICTHYSNLLKKKPENAHAVLLAEPLKNRYINPIEIIMSSEQQEGVVEAIRKVISAAGREQLYCDKPGLIVCFLEGIDGCDLEELNSNSALQIMTCYQLNKPEFTHVMAVSYTAEQRISRCCNVDTFDYPYLIFRNPRCKFEDAEKYELL